MTSPTRRTTTPSSSGAPCRWEAGLSRRDGSSRITPKRWRILRLLRGRELSAGDIAYFADPAKMVRWIGTEATLAPVSASPPARRRPACSGQPEMLGVVMRNTSTFTLLSPDPAHSCAMVTGFSLALIVASLKISRVPVAGGGR